MTHDHTTMHVPLARQKRIMPSLFSRALSGVSFESAYEPFAGDAKLALHFKREGKRVVSGDQIPSHYAMAQAYIANGHHRVTHDEWQAWQTIVKDPDIVNRFRGWSQCGLTPEAIVWLGLWHHHLMQTPIHPISQAIGIGAVGLVLKHWRNQSPNAAPHHHRPQQLFAHYVQRLNSWVCDNGQDNHAIFGDANEQAPGVDADVLLCYPPTHLGSQDRINHIWMHESWVRGHHTPALPPSHESANGAPALGESLDSMEYAHALTRFFARVTHLPVWAIGYNSAEPIRIKAFKALVEKFRPVRRLVSCPFRQEETDEGVTEYVLIAQ
jgi:hypothetical protein